MLHSSSSSSLSLLLLLTRTSRGRSCIISTRIWITIFIILTTTTRITTTTAARRTPATTTTTTNAFLATRSIISAIILPNRGGGGGGGDDHDSGEKHQKKQKQKSQEWSSWSSSSFQQQQQQQNEMKQQYGFENNDDFLVNDSNNNNRRSSYSSLLSVNDIVEEMRSYSTLAGNVRPFLDCVRIHYQEWKYLWEAMRVTIHVQDIIFLMMVGWLTIPTVRIAYQLLANSLLIGRPTTSTTTSSSSGRTSTTSTRRGVVDNGVVVPMIDDHEDDIDTENNEQLQLLLEQQYSYQQQQQEQPIIHGEHAGHQQHSRHGRRRKSSTRSPGRLSASPLSFYNSFAYVMADHTQQIARIALLIYFVDIIKLMSPFRQLLVLLGNNNPHIFGQSIILLWFTNRISIMKRYWIRQYVNSKPNMWGRMNIINQLCNNIIVVVSIFIMVNNILLIDVMGRMSTTTSIVTLGSIGMLVVLGLLLVASQGIVKEILNGLMLATSDHIYEGDHIQFHDGFSGTIDRLGWIETILHGTDNVAVTIPNSALMNEKVSNLSRIGYCRIKQTLHFKYTTDVDKIDSIIRCIKEEIELRCPTLITDGTKPYRVHWTSIGCSSNSSTSGEDRRLLSSSSSTSSSYLEVTVDTHFPIRPMINDEYWDNRQRVLRAIATAIKKTGANII